MFVAFPPVLVVIAVCCSNTGSNLAQRILKPAQILSFICQVTINDREKKVCYALGSLVERNGLL